MALPTPSSTTSVLGMPTPQHTGPSEPFQGLQCVSSSGLTHCCTLKGRTEMHFNCLFPRSGRRRQHASLNRSQESIKAVLCSSLASSVPLRRVSDWGQVVTTPKEIPHF